MTFEPLKWHLILYCKKYWIFIFWKHSAKSYLLYYCCIAMWWRAVNTKLPWPVYLLLC